MIALRHSSLSGKIIVFFIFCFSIFVLYGRTHFYRDPGSVFYDQARAYKQSYSALRLRQVEQVRNAVELHGGKIYASDSVHRPRPEICVTITTSYRPNVKRQYIEDTIISMLDSITAQERAMLHLNILFTYFDAPMHPSWQQPWLRTMLDNVWSYDNEDTLITPELRSWLKNITSPFTKTKAVMDYTLALEKCLQSTDAPYIAAFEGDILFAAGWVAPTLQALKSADGLMQQKSVGWLSKSKSARDWIHMRIFNQERSTGWSSRKIGGNNELAIIMVVDALLSLLVLLLRSRNAISSHSLDNTSLAVICMLIVPVSVVSFFQAGKASLLPPGPGLVVENFGCCSQALIFNRKHVPSLVTYLRDFAMQEMNGTSKHVNYDLRTTSFARKNGLDRLALYPMQVQHMGIKSTLGASESEAQSVWSMAFEDLTDAGVATRHDRAMDELFGTEWRARKQAS